VGYNTYTNQDIRGGGYESEKAKLKERLPSTITTPATDAAREWSGWGTALKPAYEPILVARKPIEGTVAANVLKYGTGGINVDGCRVESMGAVCGTSKSHSTPQDGWDRPWRHDSDAAQRTYDAKRDGNRKAVEMGRWPANVIHDGSEEVLVGFPHSASGAMKKPYLYTNTGNSLGTPTGST
jgi:site-specific DNA-methyltransferase (adenine-specific)